MDNPCKLYEIHNLTWTPVNYMKYTPLYGHPVNYMKYITLHGHSPVNYMKYIPLHGQPCKLYEIHTHIWTTLQIMLNTYPYMDTCKLYEIHTFIWTTL